MTWGTRRSWLSLGAVGGLALLAGGWLRRSQDQQNLSEAAQQALWAAEFQTPAGDTLKVADFKGQSLVINFWATWCPPCVEEMPLIDDFFDQNSSKGWMVLGLAIDQPSRVRNFLSQFPVKYPIGLAGLNGTELGKLLGNNDAALPFTLVLGKDGKVLQRKLGRLSVQEIDAWQRMS